MGASASAPARPDRWQRAVPGLFSTTRARTRAASHGAEKHAHAAAPPPPALSPDLSAALQAVAAGAGPAATIADLRAAWEADHATLLTAVRALTAAVTGVGPAAGGGDATLPPAAVAGLAAGPAARAIAAAANAGRTLEAEVALNRLLDARPDLSVPALTAAAPALGFDAGVIARRAASVRALLAACDGASAGSDGWVRLVDQGYAALTVDYRRAWGERGVVSSSSSFHSTLCFPLSLPFFPHARPRPAHARCRTVRPDPTGPTLHALIMNDCFPGPPSSVLGEFWW